VVNSSCVSLLPATFWAAVVAVAAGVVEGLATLAARSASESTGLLNRPRQVETEGLDRQ